MSAISGIRAFQPQAGMQPKAIRTQVLDEVKNQCVGKDGTVDTNKLALLKQKEGEALPDGEQKNLVMASLDALAQNGKQYANASKAGDTSKLDAGDLKVLQGGDSNPFAAKFAQDVENRLKPQANGANEQSPTESGTGEQPGEAAGGGEQAPAQGKSAEPSTQEGEAAPQTAEASPTGEAPAAPQTAQPASYSDSGSKAPLKGTFDYLAEIAKKENRGLNGQDLTALADKIEKARESGDESEINKYKDVDPEALRKTAEKLDSGEELSADDLQKLGKEVEKEGSLDKGLEKVDQTKTEKPTTSSQTEHQTKPPKTSTTEAKAA